MRRPSRSIRLRTYIPIFGPLFVGIKQLNVDDEFAKLASILVMGTPVPICLAALGTGHHVLAIGCNPAPPLVIFAYDPNAPGKIAIIQQLPGGMFKNSQSSHFWPAFFVDDSYSKTPWEYVPAIQTATTERKEATTSCR